VSPLLPAGEVELRALRDPTLVSPRSTRVSSLGGVVPGTARGWSGFVVAVAMPSARAGAKFGCVLGVSVAASMLRDDAVFAGALLSDAHAAQSPSVATAMNPSLLFMVCLSSLFAECDRS
jgi:hypothetical protein